jgi:ribosome maturation factor RimP
MPVTERTELVNAITALTEQAAAGTGIEIADVELRGSGKVRLLRIYIDKPSGVTHGDCELISQRVGTLLDERDLMPDESYTLEVSSPGLERPLRKARDFERVAGQTIKIGLKEPVNGQKYLEGKLLGVSGDRLQLELSSGESIQVGLDQIHKANLKFRW